MLIAPLMMGAVLFAVSNNPLSALFILMMPLFVVGHYVDQKMRTKRQRKEQLKHFRAAMAAFRQDTTELQRVERAVRLQEAPSVSDTVDPSTNWVRCCGPTGRSTAGSWAAVRARHRAFAVPLEEPGSNDTEVEYRPRNPELHQAVPAHRRRSGGIPAPDRRLAGHRRARGLVDDVARGVVLQLVGLHSPAEVVLTPSPPPSPGNGGTGSSGCRTSAPATAPFPVTTWPPVRPAAHPWWPASKTSWRLSEAAAGVPARTFARAGSPKDEADAPVVPAVLVIVEDDAPVDRGRLTRLVERGPDAGVHVLWIATDVQALPAACRDFMAVDGEHGTTTGQVRLGRHTYPVSCESVDAALAAQLARMLTPVWTSANR
jgi:S-DNA-T family DNA segregation ATPase FtsK/SpoIIIE